MFAAVQAYIRSFSFVKSPLQPQQSSGWEDPENSTTSTSDEKSEISRKASPLSFLRQLVEPHKISSGNVTSERSERFEKIIQSKKETKVKKPGFTFDVTNHPMKNVNARNINLEEDDQKSQDSFIVHSEFSGLIPVLHRIQQSNGLVNGIAEAYNQHHHLILRPDDIWLAMLVQFSQHVEKNAEKLRESIVKFDTNDADVTDGKKRLIVYGDGNLYTAQYDQLCAMMSKEIAKHLVDPSIREWIIPEFSTTTEKDRVCGAITMMSSMKSYFNYEFHLRCGLPRVTLEGTVEDWQKLQHLANRFLEFETGDGHMKQWHSLFTPVLDEFVNSASGSPDLEFWKLVVHYQGNGSGPRFLSGWITVFCPYDDKGTWMCDLKKTPILRGDIFRGDSDDGDVFSRWPKIDTNRIPSGSCCVDVIVNDNGTIYNCELVAGHGSYIGVGTQIRPNVEWSLSLKKDKTRNS